MVLSCVKQLFPIILTPLILSLAAAESTVKRPDNIAALSGSTVVFQCTSSANNQTRWDYYQHGVNQPSTIFNGERVDWRVSDRFTVDVHSCMRRHCDLTVHDVRPSDAGYFVCFEPSRSNRRSAALVVLESDPRCHVNLTRPDHSLYLSDFVEVSCSVNFSGTWKPIFHCRPQGDYDVDTVDTDVTRTGVAYQRVIAASSITNYTAIECSMQFDMAVQPTATLPELTDSPVPPSYAYSWNSPAIHIIDDRFQPRSTEATPTVHDVTTGSAARKTTIASMVMSTDAKPTLGAVKHTGSSSHETVKSTGVLYITLALIGLLAVCVFVIAGLVLVVAKRRREAVRRSMYGVPASAQNDLACMTRCTDALNTQSGGDRPASSGHYDVIIDDCAVASSIPSGNCGQDYDELDELIRRQPVDESYLMPVEYSLAAAAAESPATCAMPYDLLDTNQTNNGHIYVQPAKPTKR